MDKGLRVVGFTFSNHGESTLNVEVANAKLHTQRSLLSELLAIHVIGDDGLSDSGSDDSADDDEDDDYDAVEEPAPVARMDTVGLTRTDPIPIPCPESLANQRAKDAYRRLVYQRQVEHLYYQKQQQLLIQQQRRLQLQQQQQLQRAPTKHEPGQEHGVVDVQTRGQIATVPVY